MNDTAFVGAVTIFLDIFNNNGRQSEISVLCGVLRRNQLFAKEHAKKLKIVDFFRPFDEYVLL